LERRIDGKNLYRQDIQCRSFDMSYIAFHTAVNRLSRQAILWYTGRQSKAKESNISTARFLCRL
jgi:hypothetical protein